MLVPGRHLALEGPIAMTSHPPTKPGALAKELAQTIAGSLVLWLVLHTVSQPYVVEGHSMEGTLHDGNRLWVNQLDTPARGEVIVFHAPTEDKIYVKRVIGLPGEHVRISDGVVTINDHPLAEPYLAGMTPCAPSGDRCDLVVPPGMVFVLGDNRGNSSDSRAWGPLDLTRVAGRAWMIYWPLGEMGPLAAP